MGAPARPKKMYSAARAFYLTIVVILSIAAWSFAGGRRAAPAGSSKGLLPRGVTATSEGVSSFANDLVPRDLEVDCFLNHRIIQLSEEN